MAKLPFIVAPKFQTKKVKIGTEELGIVEIEKRGYLSVAEKSFVDSVMQGTDGVAMIVRLANTVSRKKKITVEKAYNIIVQILSQTSTTGVASEIADEYTDDLANIQTQMIDSLRRKSIAATTILIQSRINPEWTIDDTLTLDPDLLQYFVDFYDGEDARTSVEEKEEVKKDEEEQAAEIVGK